MYYHCYDIGCRKPANVFEIKNIYIFVSAHKILISYTIILSCIGNRKTSNSVIINFILLQSASDLGKSTTEEVIDGIKGLGNWGDMGMAYLPKIIGALLIGIIGYWLIKWVTRLFITLLRKRHIEESLQAFLSSVIKVSLVILLVLTIVSILGVNMTGFAALLAGAGIALGSTLNGTLGNFAGGVMILILKPFKVGDLIEAQQQFGIVKEIGIVYTSV